MLKEEWLNNWGHSYTEEHYTAIKKKEQNISENPLVVQWLGLSLSTLTAGAPGSIPAQGINIP